MMRALFAFERLETPFDVLERYSSWLLPPFRRKVCEFPAVPQRSHFAVKVVCGFEDIAPDLFGDDQHRL